MSALESYAGRGAVAPAEAPAYRVPPHNVEAEQALLGAIILNNDAFDRV